MNFQGTIITGNGTIIATINNKSYTVAKNHPYYNKLKQYVKDGNAQDFVDNFPVTKIVDNYLKSNQTGLKMNNDGVITYNGEVLHNEVTKTIANMHKEGFNIDPMMKFLANYMKNPSYNSRQELWKFIDAMGLTITEDGCFLAYKSVRSDYKDKYTGKIDNTPGQKPERLDRSEVDDNPNHTCSHGYHVGALGYAGPGGWCNGNGDRVLICKVDPADVVSVPTDHSGQKLRCCYYEPVGEFEAKLESSVYSGEVGSVYNKPQCVCNEECEDEEAEVFDTVDDMLEGEMYKFEYYNHGSWVTRYMVMEDYDNEHVYGYLVDPEPCAGEFRSFLKEKMDDVQLVDTKKDDEEDKIDLPW